MVLYEMASHNCLTVAKVTGDWTSCNRKASYSKSASPSQRRPFRIVPRHQGTQGAFAGPQEGEEY